MCFFFILAACFLIIANTDEWPHINMFKIMRGSLDLLAINADVHVP